MSDVTISPNMNLPVPIVGQELAPTWATDLNNSLNLIDSHNHSANQGVQINPSGININADLPFNGNNAISLRTTRFVSQLSPIPASGLDIGCLYESGVDLYYNDGAGNQIRITQGGNVAGAAGTITGLPSGTASASYQSSSGTFVFDQATSTGANIDVASIIIRYPGSYPTPAGNFILLEAPSSLSGGYSLILPSIPASTSIVTLDTSGNIVGNTAYTATVNQGINPSGVILAFGGSSAPAGYILCNGSAVSRTTFASLFSVIGTTYGVGDGSTTFNVPNMMGVFARGAGSQTIGGVTYSATLGASSNDSEQGHYHTLTSAGIPYYNDYAPGGTTIRPLNISPAAENPNNQLIGSTMISDGTNGTPRIGFETAPANVGVNYIIKT